MKAAIFFNVIFVLLGATGCEVLFQEESIEIEDIFDAMDAAARAMKQQNAKELLGVKVDVPPVIDGALNDVAWQKPHKVKPNSQLHFFKPFPQKPSSLY